MENRLDELTSMVRQLAVTQTVQPSAQQISNLCGICCDPSHPTNTVPNPKGTNNVSTISLRSGKQLEEPNQSAVESSQGGDTGSRKQNTDTSDVHIMLPFPQRATQSKKQAAKAQDKEILDTFRKVEVNIPLLDAIQQIPRYAKFLKELCTNKRRLKRDERVSVIQNVSALIQPIPKKCQDPGTFTIPCIIENSVFHDCMLDFGASINVMPEFVYKSLGLGPLRATGIIVQLANKSSVHPSGVVEDILVRVNNLIFPADFYVLGMEGETPSSTIILGRPFTKTARTKIDVHAGTFSMEFGDSMVNFNIFDAMKYPREEHYVFCIDIIDEMVDDIFVDLIAEYPEFSSFLDLILILIMH
ncbi:uncharacterized protein LOC133293048 [Gastrolobium bilobum]|uniref:uncharacterized protein LOC133293048 n=1 Tax=Gastrolobium bilobum TaxID=150636 RepID=UPI002AB1D96B|nr:uncharacterized protein LOC133293048 [Gastrolobium bilobum]